LVMSVITSLPDRGSGLGAGFGCGKCRLALFGALGRIDSVTGG
jgi:hypothetical protein